MFLLNVCRQFYQKRLSQGVTSCTYTLRLWTIYYSYWRWEFWLFLFDFDKKVYCHRFRLLCFLHFGTLRFTINVDQKVNISKLYPEILCCNGDLPYFYFWLWHPCPHVGSLPDTQIAHKDLDIVSKDLKDQEQFNIQAGGFKQDLLECVPTANISESKSTIQSGISTQSAGESLVDLTIDPDSPKKENGLAPLENLEKT